MKPRFLDSIVFFTIAPLTMLTLVLLILTFSSTTKFSRKNLDRKDVSVINNKKDIVLEQSDVDTEYLNFKIHEMKILENKNQDFIKIREGSNEMKISSEEKTLLKTNHLKIENTQLTAGFAYQIKNTDWQKFKFNFSINFRRMMVLSFSELFDN